MNISDWNDDEADGEGGNAKELLAAHQRGLRASRQKRNSVVGGLQRRASMAARSGAHRASVGGARPPSAVSGRVKLGGAESAGRDSPHKQMFRRQSTMAPAAAESAASPHAAAAAPGVDVHPHSSAKKLNAALSRRSGGATRHSQDGKERPPAGSQETAAAVASSHPEPLRSSIGGGGTDAHGTGGKAEAEASPATAAPADPTPAAAAVRTLGAVSPAGPSTRRRHSAEAADPADVRLSDAGPVAAASAEHPSASLPARAGAVSGRHSALTPARKSARHSALAISRPSGRASAVSRRSGAFALGEPRPSGDTSVAGGGAAMLSSRRVSVAHGGRLAASGGRGGGGGLVACLAGDPPPRAAAAGAARLRGVAEIDEAYDETMKDAKSLKWMRWVRGAFFCRPLL